MDNDLKNREPIHCDQGSVDPKNHGRRTVNFRRLERTLAVVAIGIVVVAWIMGTFRSEADLFPILKQALPEADRFEAVRLRTYSAWNNQTAESLMGYVTTGKADGYGGEMEMAVAVSLDGVILGLAIVEQKETAAFLQRVLRSGLLDSLRGKSYSDPITLGQDVDGVTGATYSCQAITDSTRKATRKVASRNLALSLPPEPDTKVRFGFPEVVLIALFGFGIVGRWRRFKYKKTARWVSMLVGLVVLGFVVNMPLTIVWVNKFLLGFWPAWQNHLYWFILFGGILFITIIGNKNPYCEWFCPFGATQECLGIVSGAKVRIPQRAHNGLRWIQRLLALTAIVVALIFRNPGISSYEVFGAFFRLIGSNFQFALLGVVLVASLFIRRPWCSYLCPLRPVTDLIRMIRNWIRELWLKDHRKRREINV
jgi:NosR/NirI family nitrous oxide reductase transcriptional regulator